MKDGRRFQVTWAQETIWYNESYGTGGGEFKTVYYKVWEGIE